jgi:hypothetical protein
VGKAVTSVAEALGRAHAALLEDLRKLEEVVHAISDARLAELRARLGVTRMHLTEHFRFEEQSGYMDVVRKREPRLERAVQQLADEHGQLRQTLDALIGELGSATHLDEALREKIPAWIKQVREHETRENDLVQDAFDLDIGAED